MAGSDTGFTGSIPELYDTLLVPMIFEQPAADLARRVAAAAPEAVLETAAGTGVLTRVLAPLLPPGARYLATDLNQPMLDRAASRQPPLAGVDWRQADAMALPFPDATFDAVCCQFGAMFFPDRIAGFREARRVLRPGGRFLFSAWGRIEDNGFAARVTEAAAALFPDDPPRFLARTPHGYADPQTIRADLAAAGFAAADVETMQGTSAAPSARHVATAYCQGTPLSGELEALAPGRLAELTGRVAAALAETFGTGPVSAPIRWLVATASG